MGNISTFVVKNTSIEMIKFTAKLDQTSFIILGILFCIIIIFGFYILKNYKNYEIYSETENIKLGENKGFIRKKNDE